MDGWSPGAANGANSGGWGRKEDNKDGAGGPEICWDHEGNVRPLALIEMADDEREVCLLHDHFVKVALTVLQDIRHVGQLSA